MIFSRKEMPSMLGISTSSVTTSGLRSLIIWRATSGSGAAPTTSMSRSPCIMLDSSWRMSAESSTTSTGTLSPIFRLLVEQVDAAVDRLDRDAALELHLRLEHRLVGPAAELQHLHLARLREVVDAARMIAADVLGRDRHAF